MVVENCEVEDSPMTVGTAVVVIVVVEGNGDAVITAVPLNIVVGCRSFDGEAFSGAGHNHIGQGTHDGNIWLTFSGGVTINT